MLLAALALAPQDALGHGWMAVPGARQLCNIKKLGRFITTGGLNKGTFLCMFELARSTHRAKQQHSQKP